MFFKLNTHQIFLQKYPKCCSRLRISQREKKWPATHVPRLRGGAPGSPGLLGSWGLPALQGSHVVCCHVDVSSIPTLIDNFGSKSSRKSWRRTVHVSDSAWVAAQAGLCKENRQGPLSPASLGFGSRPSSFQAMKGQPVPGGAHRELLLSSTLSIHT